MKRRLTFAWLALLLTLVAGVASAQSIPLEIEVGYRWLDVSGNSDMYRTQINEDGGLLLRALSISSPGLGDSRIFDHFRLDVSELGAGPAGSVRLDAGKSELYRLRMTYREMDAFSAYPGIANPFLESGVVPGQHTYDRARTMLDGDIEFLPGGRIVPFLGYSYATYKGPGSTTYFLGQDEFARFAQVPVSRSVSLRDRSPRAGATCHRRNRCASRSAAAPGTIPARSSVPRSRSTV
jgi:hypothetical protein